MTEALLHFVWQHQLFDGASLKTQSGHSFSVVYPGRHNTHAGADFEHAKIQWKDALLVGNVELHIHQRDWQTHHHQHDAAYNNTILHVVYEADETPTSTANGVAVEVFCLKPYVSQQLLVRYQQLMDSQHWIACAAHIHAIEKDIRWENFLERVAIERLEQKVREVEKLLSQNQSNWDEVAYRLMATYLGAHTNNEPFAQLAASLPLAILQKHIDSLLSLEALLLGQAGFLEKELQDDYAKHLQKEYRYLKRLHNLTPMDVTQWKFLRLRPAAFPTVRLAMLAKLLHQQPRFFAQLLLLKKVEDVHALLQVNTEGYWQSHYQFDKASPQATTSLGNNTRELLLINAIVPLLFAYGKTIADESYCECAIDLLRQTSAEKNSIIKNWGKLQVPAANALSSQALLQLKSHYCEQKKCLQCVMGNAILK